MKSQAGEIWRYVINGMIATILHYCVLSFNIEFLEFDSAGLANLIAAFFGVTVSFFGSRYFVFRNTTKGIFDQGLKFFGLYGMIAILHGLSLWLWVDLLGLNYRLGFLIVTGMQVFLSYLGNKFLVFKG